MFFQIPLCQHNIYQLVSFLHIRPFVWFTIERIKNGCKEKLCSIIKQ